MEQLPKKMKAVVLEEFSKLAIAKEVDVPEIQEGEVLIKVEAAPINPSDLGFLRGGYSTAKIPPTIPGFEGSGVVVAGKGQMEQSIVGKRVTFTPKQGFYGTYGEYCVSTFPQCLPIPDSISFDIAASTFVNPFTVLVMLDLVKKANVKAVVHTAAASQLGRMMVRYFQKNGVQVINVVRRQEQVDILKKEGAEHILNSSDENFATQLKELTHKLEAKIAFEAIGGDITGVIFSALPASSSLYLYGGLAGKPVSGLGIGDLIFSDKTLKGFWLVQELKNYSIQEKIAFTQQLVSLLDSDLKSEISKTFTYEQFGEALEYYTKNMTAGKVLIKRQI